MNVYYSTLVLLSLFFCNTTELLATTQPETENITLTNQNNLGNFNLNTDNHENALTPVNTAVSVTETIQTDNDITYRLKKNKIIFQFSTHSTNFEFQVIKKNIEDKIFKLKIIGIFEEEILFDQSQMEIILKNDVVLKDFKNALFSLFGTNEEMEINHNKGSIVIKNYSIETLFKILFFRFTGNSIMDIELTKVPILNQH